MRTTKLYNYKYIKCKPQQESIHRIQLMQKVIILCGILHMETIVAITV